MISSNDYNPWNGSKLIWLFKVYHYHHRKTCYIYLTTFNIYFWYRKAHVDQITYNLWHQFCGKNLQINISLLYDVLVLLYNKGQGHLFVLRQIDFLLNFIERICIPSPNIVYRIPTSVNSDLQNQILLNTFIWFCCIQWNRVYPDNNLRRESC